MERALLGGGCFWCTEGAYKRMKGIVSALPAYAGGPDKNPNYKSVCSGTTGHAEIVEIMYDSSIIDYSTILDIFFTVHDPTQLNRQGNDIGPQYRSIVFVDGENEMNSLNEILSEVEDWFDDPIVTEIVHLSDHIIYSAEGYHQDYFANNPQNPYCSFVVAPKVVKVRKKFTKLYS